MKKLLQALGFVQKMDLSLTYKVGDTTVTINAKGSTADEVERLMEIADLFVNKDPVKA